MISPRSDKPFQADKARPYSAKGRKAEGGYALMLTALLLIPLMAITAIGVDIGIWYLQAAQNQRIADAASLAGTVWMPDQAKAEAVALEAVALNGLTPGVDSTVSVEFLGSASIKVKVSTVSELAFSGAFIDQFAITRGSIAEYAPPLELGSPTSQLGDPGLYLAISGECSIRENGDLRASRTVAGYPGASYPPAPCGLSSPNPDFADGYLLAVTIDNKPSQPVTVQVYDGTYMPYTGKNTDLELAQPSDFDTTFELYDAPGPPLDTAGHTLLASRTFASRDAATDSVWATIGTIPNPEPGTYYIWVSTKGSGGNHSFGSNGFAVRAFAGAIPTSCSTLAFDPDFDPTCPQVHAVRDLPLYASLSGGSSQFYLANIEEKHAGKKLEISLFDVGEGAERIEILDPYGDPIDFTWTSDCSITTPTPGCSGSAGSWTSPVTGVFHPYTLDVSGTGQQVYADTLSQSTWNDRTVVLLVDIPAGYTSHWWQVRYHFGDDINDRTTWSIRVVGDPTRLTG